MILELGYFEDVFSQRIKDRDEVGRLKWLQGSGDTFMESDRRVSSGEG